MTDTPKTGSLHTRAQLLAEQARIVARLAEITSLLSLENPPAKVSPEPQTEDSDDFDRRAYAIGLIWRNPDISTRELAQKVGVSKSTLFLPSWSDVAAVLRARKKLSLDRYKDYHTDNDPEDDE